MKKKFLLVLFLIFTLNGFSQKKEESEKHLLQIVAGKNFNGTGDINGVSFKTSYSQFFKNKLFWSVDFGGTLHDGKRALFFNAPGGQLIDGSIRYTVGGIQASYGIGYSIVKNADQSFQIKIGGLFRYQSSSYYDDVSILYPAGTGLPIPVVSFINTSPQRTSAVGGFGAISYNYTIAHNIVVGILAGLQTDTNGDTLTDLSFSIGKKF